MNSLILTCIGKPYEPLAAGPDSFDCYGIYYYVQTEILKNQVPRYLDPKLTNLKSRLRFMNQERCSCRWKELPAPENYCLVAMGEKERVTHVGMFLDVDGGKVLHAIENSFSAAVPFSYLRRIGLSYFLYYTYMGE